MKLYTYKEITIMNNYPQQKFQFVIKSKFYINDIKIFGTTLCYYKVDDYDIFKVVQFLPLKV